MNLLDNHKLRVKSRTEGQDPLLENAASCVEDLHQLQVMIMHSNDGSNNLGDNERSTLYVAMKSCLTKLEALAVKTPE